jgi:hypothetical protein
VPFRGSIPLSVGFALVAVGAWPAGAQTVGDQSGLFHPVLDGEPRAVPGFRQAQAAQQIDRTRFGDIPGYGSPPGSGAGVTGFDSRNRRKVKRKAPPGAAPQSTIAASTPVMPLTLLPPPPPPATMPQYAHRGAPPTDSVAGAPLTPVPAVAARKRPSDEDAFEPVGLRAGAFVLKPAIELTGGRDSNPQHVSAGGGSSLFIVAPELQVRSDWQRHALNADIKGSYTTYGTTFVPDLDRPTLDAKIDGRIDITRNNQIDLQGRLFVGTDNPGSPNLQAGLARLPIFVTTGGTFGYTQRFNRFELSAKGGIDRTVYDMSQLTDGTTSSNDDRNFDQYALALRGGYELTPGVKPFIEGTIDTRVHDLVVDRNGLQRDSDGYSIRAGSSFEITRKLTGEISGGFASRSYKDLTLPQLDGPLAAASLIWIATALTTVKLEARTSLDETTLAGVSGTLRRDFTLEVDHAFRRWLIGTLKFGYGMDNYVGSTRIDDRYSASAGLVYKMNRNMQLKAELRRDWLHSTVFGVDYGSTAVLLGLRLQD